MGEAKRIPVRLLIVWLVMAPGIVSALASGWYLWDSMGGSLFWFSLVAVPIGTLASGMATGIYYLLQLVLRFPRDRQAPALARWMLGSVAAGLMGWILGVATLAWVHRPTNYPTLDKFSLSIRTRPDLPVPGLVNLWPRGDVGSNMRVVERKPDDSWNQLFTVDTNTGGYRCFAWSEPEGGEWGLMPFWSRSLQSLVMLATGDKYLRVFRLDRQHHFRWVFSLPLRDISNCNVSPSGGEVLCRLKVTERLVVRAYTIEEHPVQREFTVAGPETIGERRASDPFALSPDEKQIAFVSPSEEIVVASLADGQRRTLGQVHWVHHLVWSPDGRRLAVTGVPKSREAALWISDRAEAGPGNLRFIISKNDDNDGIHSLVWLPDSERLAVMADWDGECMDTTWVHTCEFSLFTLKSDGTNLLKLSRRTQGGGTLVWLD